MKTLDEFIFYKKSFFPEKLCDLVLMEYQDETFVRGEHHTSLEYRNLSELNITSQEVIDRKNSYVRKQIDGLLFQQFGKGIQEYKTLNENLVFESDQGYSLRKMVQGEYYKEHIDQSENNSWKITASVVINDNFEGGDFCFFNRELKYTLKKGDLLMFPSNFMYPHEVSEITKGTRYALVTWFY